MSFDLPFQVRLETSFRRIATEYIYPLMSRLAPFAADMDLESPRHALDDEYAEDRGHVNNEFLTGPNVDELCCQLLDALLASDGSIAWKGEVVLRLRVLLFTGVW